MKNAKLYFECVQTVLKIHGSKAEKWLDDNSSKLSGDASTKEEAIFEIKKVAKNIS